MFTVFPVKKQLSIFCRCLDRVLFNILLAEIPRKANCNTDFFPVTQIDPNSTLQMKLTDRVSIGENEVETEANAPDASLSNISEITPFSEDVQPVADTQFINQLKTWSFWPFFSKATFWQSGCCHNEFLLSFIDSASKFDQNYWLWRHFQGFTELYTTSWLGHRTTKRWGYPRGDILEKSG